VIAEGGADGIYFSVQSVQDARVPSAAYRAVIIPGERKILHAASAAGAGTSCTVCGYEGCRNDLSLFADYEASAVNWAVGVENVSLRGEKTVRGQGRDRRVPERRGGLLHAGSREDIEARSTRSSRKRERAASSSG
jgi:uroporphyrinogen decarboxylase